MKLDKLVAAWDRSEYPLIFADEAKKLLNVAEAAKEYLKESEEGVSYNKIMDKLELLKVTMRELEKE